MFPLPETVRWSLQRKGRLLPNVSGKEIMRVSGKINGNKRSNLAYFVCIWNISNISSHKKLLKLSSLFIFMLRLDWVYREMLKDTYLKVTKPSTLETNNPLHINVPVLFNQQKPSSGGVFSKKCVLNFLVNFTGKHLFPF